MIGISFLILTGLVAGIIFSIKAARYARNKAIATRLARERIEELKLEKQTDAFWTALPASLPGTWDCADEVTGLGENSNFTRQTCYGEKVTDPVLEKDKVPVKIDVWWGERGSGEKKNSVILTSVLSNWEE